MIPMTYLGPFAGDRPPQQIPPPVPVVVRLARVLAVVGIVLNATWGLVVGLFALGLFGFAMLGVMWGSGCRPSSVEMPWLLCGRTTWPALAVAVGGVVLTGVLQGVALPRVWRQTSLMVPALTGLVITTATALAAWLYARSGR